jgi:hypothetical protein
VKQNKKGQTWSFDLLVAVVIFIVIVSIFYAVLSKGGEKDTSIELQTDAKALGYVLNCDLSTNEYCLLSGNQLNQTQVQKMYDEFFNDSYAGLKSALNMQGDFCIYFRDKEGRLIPLTIQDGTSTKQITGIGHPDFMITEYLKCNEEITED